jgi:hypothetical protein
MVLVVLAVGAVGAAAATLATGVAGAGATLGACLQCLQTGKSGNSDVATGNWKRTGNRNRQKTLLDTSKLLNTSFRDLSKSAAWCIKDITKAAPRLRGDELCHFLTRESQVPQTTC